MAPTFKSRLVADVKCYFCGHVAGSVQSEDVNQPRWTTFRRPGEGEAKRLRDWRQIKCQVCGGPTYLDEVRMVRERPEPTDLWSDARNRSQWTKQGKHGLRARRSEA